MTAELILREPPESLAFKVLLSLDAGEEDQRDVELELLFGAIDHSPKWSRAFTSISFPPACPWPC